MYTTLLYWAEEDMAVLSGIRHVKCYIRFSVLISVSSPVADKMENVFSVFWGKLSLIGQIL